MIDWSHIRLTGVFLFISLSFLLLRPLHHGGVLQGAILGPLLFFSYMLPCWSIFKKHNLISRYVWMNLMIHFSSSVTWRTSWTWTFCMSVKTRWKLLAAGLCCHSALWGRLLTKKSDMIWQTDQFCLKPASSTYDYWPKWSHIHLTVVLEESDVLL